VPPEWLSRAKLARAAGVTRATVKHYNDLGLLPAAIFTGPNMAYYDPASVERIALVRRLRAERHLPLGVIAQMLAEQGAERVAQELHRSRLLRADVVEALAGDRRLPVSRDELLDAPGIDERVLGELEKMGLVRLLRQGKEAQYDRLSLRVARAVGAMRAGGLTEESGLQVTDLSIYRKKLEALVRAEIRLFESRVVGHFEPSTEERYVRTALRGADALVLALRDRLLADLLGEDESSQPRDGDERHES